MHLLSILGAHSLSFRIIIQEQFGLLALWQTTFAIVVIGLMPDETFCANERRGAEIA